MFGGIPFGFPPGMGGMPPPGMGGGDDSDDEEVDTMELYTTLGIEKTATSVEIKKAYHLKAKVCHPDKGGDEETFKSITEAYETLKDPETRKIYDRLGRKGLEKGDAPDHDDMMRMFFGGGAPRQRGPRKAEATMVPLRATLEELYVGFTRTETVQVTELTADPAGTVMDRRGNRYNRKITSKTLEVVVERGAKNRQRIVKAGEGDIMPGTTQGDVVFVIQERDHDTFQRKGSDLIMKREITLYEALCGTKFAVNHLDGHRVLISSPEGMVIKHETIMQVPEEGMPVFGSTFVKGCLFVQFDVQFPESLEMTDAMKRVFAGVLPTPDAEDMPEETEDDVVGVLEPMNMEARRDRERLAREAEVSDDESGGPGGFPGQAVQCAHQ